MDPLVDSPSRIRIVLHTKKIRLNCRILVSLIRKGVSLQDMMLRENILEVHGACRLKVN